MTFISFRFLFLFLPVCTSIYWLLSLFNNVLLLKITLSFFSIVFFYINDNKFLPSFLAILLFNFIISHFLIKLRTTLIKKLLLIIAISANLIILFFYKHSDYFFFLDSLVDLDVTLPLGLSFLIFALLSYLIDCYENKIDKVNLTDFILFSSFFPKLTIGPITFYKDCINQFENKSLFRFNPSNFFTGLFILFIGLGKKVLVAEPLLSFTSSVLAANKNNFMSILLSLFTNMYAIYFDFSVYCDMSIGIAKLFNLTLPENFKKPYKARNMQDYWKRWNLNFGLFFNRYLFRFIYKPTGGISSFLFSTLFIFFISGFWHGITYKFILWATLHGLSVCAVAFLAFKYPDKKSILNPIISKTLTYIFILILAYLYSSHSISHFNYLITSIFSSNTYSISLFIYENSYTIIILIISIIITVFAKTTSQCAKDCLKRPYYFFIAAFIFSLSLFLIMGVSDFVYMGL